MTPRTRWAAVGLIASAWAGLSVWLLAFGGLARLASREQIAIESFLLADHVVIHIALAFSFGLTLRRGARPLITHLAEHLHGSLTPAKERYTRGVTLAWTLYFVAMTALSIAIYVVLPFGAWVLFANVGTPLALVAMFLGEYLLRFHLHPEFERAPFRDMIRAYAHARGAAPAVSERPTAESIR
jgi:uncharacterized membrane protein